MDWNKEQLESIPEVYRDFMLALKPIIDSRYEVVRIDGVPLGQIIGVLSARHDYRPGGFVQVFQNLRAQGFVDRDKFEFVTLTGKGEALIRALAGAEEPAAMVPPLPQL